MEEIVVSGIGAITALGRGPGPLLKDSEVAVQIGQRPSRYPWTDERLHALQAFAKFLRVPSG